MARRAALPVDEITTELYRGVLGREPDPGGLQHHKGLLAGGEKLSTILRAFLYSEEYIERHRQPPRYPPLDQEPPLAVESAPSAARLRQLWTHVRATWEALGEQEAFWSVLSAPRFRAERMDEAGVRQEFYDSGREDLARLDAWLARAGVLLRPDMVCAEYGCGVGRLTGWLAARCHMLHGFDISAGHLRLTQAWLDELGVGNTRLHLMRDQKQLGLLAGMDLFVSVMVLQHNPPAIMELVLDAAFRGLNPGGLAYFQLPTYRRGYSFDLAAYSASLGQDPPGTIEMHCLPQQRVYALAARHGLAPLEVQQDDRIGDWGTSHCFLLRKAG